MTGAAKIRFAYFGRLCAAALVLGSSLDSALALDAPSTGSPMPTPLDVRGAWSASASEGAHAAVQTVASNAGRTLRLDFDLRGTAGYATVARQQALTLPANYEFTFWLRADAPVNDLQIKFVDASGDNVWWFHRRDFEFPREWRQIRFTKRQIDFAWGPIADRELHRAARIEFVVAAGRDGGTGAVYFSEPELHELPPDPATWPVPLASASSQLAGADPQLAVDGNAATTWRSDPSAGREQALTLDLGVRRQIGGLIVRWRESQYASRYDFLWSDDGERWNTARSVTNGRGGPDALPLADMRPRFLRLLLHDGPAAGYGVADIEIEEPAFGASTNALVEALARDARRGTYPRGFSGEQTYWTLVGVDGGSTTALFSEDGALEVASGGFSVEPLVVDRSQVTTWADVATTQSLGEGYLPVPGVTWRHASWQLRVRTYAAGTRDNAYVVARYALTNVSSRPVAVKLVLAIRPFQVNPPSQSLNADGGVSAIRDIAWDGAWLTVNGRRAVHAMQAPARVAMAPFDAGPAPRWVASEPWPKGDALHDPFGHASAALYYDVSVAPDAAATVEILLPLSRTAADPPFEHGQPGQTARDYDATAAAWREKLNRVRIEVPPAAQPIVDTMRTALAHLLILRDGPILRPGPRSYARSWVRDGAMMSEALIRLGHADAAAAYVRWFAPHQFADGRIPCCVDHRGADPVPENDSDGEFLFLVDELRRYTRDADLQDEMWPYVVAAVRHLDSMRRSGRGAEKAPDALYGLVPASISHEGYSAKPMHSYWDDFWAVKGYAAAVDLAQVRRAAPLATQWHRAGNELHHDVDASLRASMAAHAITYLPGAAELGDFDPGSTTVAFAPGVTVFDPESPAVRATFERYWREFERRRDGEETWEAFAPYELRIVGTFVRLGWRERAQEMLAFFLADRRPQAWNQWAEVVGRDPRQIRFIGDMPHGWVASDYIDAALDIFAYERDSDHSMVLARGVPASWTIGRGVAVHDLRTPYGRLSYTLRRERANTVLRIGKGTGLPPGGFVYVASDRQRPPPATINGRLAGWRNGELHVAELPATVVVNDR